MNATNHSNAQYITLGLIDFSKKLLPFHNPPPVTQLTYLNLLFFFLLFIRLFRTSIKVPENGIPPEWYSYFLCGVKGIADELLPNDLRCGMFVTVSGNVPPAAGLSSSSALVSAATLATSYINDVCCFFRFSFGSTDSLN